jgi:O-antigen ligase
MNKRLCKIIFWSGIAFLLIFAPVARGAVKTWSVTPVFLAGSFLIFIWLLKANNTDGYRFRKTALDMPISLFLAISLISAIFSIYKHDSIYAMAGLLGYTGIYYLVVNEFDAVMRRLTVFLIPSIGASLSTYGLLQYFGFLPHGWWYPQNFLSATYVNHNHFAGYLEIAIPLAFAMLFLPSDRRNIVKPAAIMMLVVMTAAFILTQSRGGWLSLAISFFCISAILIRQRGIDGQTVMPLVIFAAIILFLIYFSGDIIPNRIDLAFSPQGREASADTRLLIWRGGVDIIKERPLTGTGIGTFVWAFPRFRPEGLNVQANAAHNDYLQISAETGIFGAFAVFWLLIALLSHAIKNMTSDPVRIGCAIGILSLSLHGLVDFNFHIPANMILFTVCAAIAASPVRNSISNGASDPRLDQRGH